MAQHQGSPPGQIALFDIKKILTGAAIATGGALCTYVLDSVLPDMEAKGIIDAAAYVFFSTLINAVRKWLIDSRVVVVLVLAVSMLFCGTAQAKPVAVIVDDEVPGATLIEVGADGTVKANPIRVIRPGPPTDPGDPPPPPPPGNPFEAEVERQTKVVLAAGGTATTGAALSSVYSLVAAEVAADRVIPASALPAVKAATDLVLSKQADGAKWTGWRTAVGDALTILSQQGQLGTKEQIASALRQVSNGLNRATGFNGNPQGLLALDPAKLGILDGIDLAQLIELIKLIMELLKLFGGFAK